MRRQTSNNKGNDEGKQVRAGNKMAGSPRQEIKMASNKNGNQ